MKKLIRHIETLIRRHDYVIIPELGGFVIQENSAKISESEITPPYVSIGFNPLMNTSDGLLAIEISRAEKISFRQAMQLIEEEISFFKSQVSKGEKVECGRIGYFTMTKEGKIVFSPTNETYNLLPSNYGLKPIYALPLAQRKEEEKAESRKVIQITLPSSRTVMKYAAAVAIAAGLFFTVPKISNNSLDFAGINPMNLFNTTKDNSKILDTTTTHFTIAEPTSSNESKPVVVEVNKKNTHIIVSCWNNAKEADEYLNLLNTAGYKEAQILPSNKLYRVSIASFESTEEASTFIKTLKDKAPQFSEAWIYTEK